MRLTAPAPFTFRIEHDDNAESPRTWDNVGVISYGHRRLILGDEPSPSHWTDCSTFEELAELVKEERGATCVLPLSAYVHSGVTMWVGSAPHAFDAAGWDSGFVGVIFDTPQTRGDMTPDEVEACLRAEVETFDAYLTGQVFGWVVSSADGDVVDSCWGYFDEDDAIAEAEATAESAHAFAVEQWQHELDEHNHALASASVTYATSQLPSA